MSSMHNTITPVANQSLDVNIEACGNKFTGASYKVYTLDGTSELESKKIKKAGKNFSLDLSADKILDEERILEVRLNRNGADPVYFYTRIVSDEDANVAQCLNYISDYHENALAKAENAGEMCIRDSRRGFQGKFREYYVGIHEPEPGGNDPADEWRIRGKIQGRRSGRGHEPSE